LLAQREAKRPRIEGRFSSAGKQPGLLKGSGKISQNWSGVAVAYAWGRPYANPARTRPNRFEVTFSSHRCIDMEVDGKAVEVALSAGGAFALGHQAVDFLRRRESGDWLEVRVANEIVGAFRDWHPRVRDGIRPTFDGRRKVDIEPDLQLLSIAHVFRRACLGRSTLSDIEADSLAHRFVAAKSDASAEEIRFNPLTRVKLDRVFAFVEEGLHRRILLSDLEDVAAISPFHFSRLFKSLTGVAPYQYVMARRMERAKHMLLSTSLPVREIGWSLGIDNVSHFRRKFVEHFGARPSELRGLP
jgi:AraC family transcriptional regulator